MTSEIDTSGINVNFPKQGTDNPSQGFRDNFSSIVEALDTAAEEITILQSESSYSTTATTTSTGVVKIGSGISIAGDGTMSVLMPTYSTSTLSSFYSASTGTIAFVSDAPGGAQPCYFDGTYWYTVNGRTRIPLVLPDMLFVTSNI